MEITRRISGRGIPGEIFDGIPVVISWEGCLEIFFWKFLEEPQQKKSAEFMKLPLRKS